MAMRITTKAIMQGYNRDLNSALNNWNAAQKKVLSQRNFSTIAENPADANRAFNLRRQYRNNNMQLEMTKQTQSLVDQVTSSAMQISKIMTQTVQPDVLKAVNGTNSLDERKAYAQSLRGMAQSIVLAANSQIGGRYIFGGASTKEVPFQYDPATNKLTYRGIDVNADPTAEAQDAKGNPITVNGKNLTYQEVWDQLSKESLYIDMGFGLEDDGKGNAISTSAFDTSTPGINMLGFGKDDNGQSNNVVVLLEQMARELEKETFSQSEYGALMDKYNDCINHITDYEAQLGTKQKFLEGTVTRLEQYNDTINERVNSIEQVNMPEAISTYTWMGYAYNAALKVGTDIVSNSLLDFMR